MSLALAAGFFLSAWGIFLQAAWWPIPTSNVAGASMAVVIPWWRVIPVGNAIGATAFALPYLPFADLLGFVMPPPGSSGSARGDHVVVRGRHRSRQALPLPAFGSAGPIDLTSAASAPC